MGQPDEIDPAEAGMPEDGPAYLIAACFLVGLAGVAGFNGVAASVHSPMPMLTMVAFVFGYMLGGDSGLTVLAKAAVGPVLLFLWHPYMFIGDADVPRRSVVGLAVLTGLSVLYFIWTWSGALRYQGWGHAVGVSVLNGSAVCLSWVLMMLALRRRNFGMTVAAHACVVGWLVYCAFPLFGEI